MANPYDIAVSKVTPGYAPAGSKSIPANSPTLATVDKAIAARFQPSGNAYTDAMQKLNLSDQIHTFNTSEVATQASIQKDLHPSVGDYLKALPGAMGQVLTGAFAHPVKTGEAVLAGLADAGVKAVNTVTAFNDFVNAKNGLPKNPYGLTTTAPGKIALGSNSSAIGDITGGTDRLPLPGQSILQYIGNDSPLAQAEETGASQFASFELGGAGVKAAGVTSKFAQSVAGNVVGGQFVMDPNATQSQRVTGAVYDAIFGGLQWGAGKVLGPIAKNFIGQTIKDANGNVVGTVTHAAESPITPQKPTSFSTVLTGDAAAEKPPANVAPITTHTAVDSLGTNPNGKKIWAATKVSTKTGNATITYDKSLDLPGNAKQKQIILDHEEGHLMDKKINGGTNISALVANPAKNAGAIEKAFGNYGGQTGQTGSEVASKIHDEITTLYGDGDMAESFAKAYADIKNDPARMAQEAPTLSGFLHQAADGGDTATHALTADMAPGFEPNILETPSEAAPADLSDEGVAARQTARHADIIEANTPKEDGIPIEEKPAPTEDAPASLPDSETPSSKSSLIAKTGEKTGRTVKDTPSFTENTIDAEKDVTDLYKLMDSDGGPKTANMAKGRMAKSNADIESLARTVGLTEEQLARSKAGSIVNSETALKARQLVINAAQKLSDKLKSFDRTTATPVELQAIKDDFLHLKAMQKGAAGFRTEAANLLRQYGIAVTPEEHFAAEELAAMLKSKLDASPEDLEGFSNKVATAQELTPGQKIQKGVLATWYASILSGPKTSVRNIMANTANIFTEMAAKAASPTGWKEIVPAMAEMINAYSEGKADFMTALKGQSLTPNKFIGESGYLKPEIFTGRFAGYGRVVESVGNMLSAQDAAFQSAARAMERASLKVYSPAMSERVSSALSETFASQTVFHGEPKSPAIAAISKGLETATNAWTPLKLVVPFVRTVANVTDRQFDYMPVFSAMRLGKIAIEDGKPTFAVSDIISAQAVKIAKEFGITSEDDITAIKQRLFNQQLGRAALGMALTAGATALAMDGRVSGNGPSSYAAKIELQRTGWRPNSIKMGDLWVPYTYFGPAAGIFGVAGSIHDAVRFNTAPTKTITDKIGDGMLGWTQTQLNTSFLSGISNLINVVSGNKTPQSYITQTVSGFVPIPALYSQSKDMVLDVIANVENDPTLKQQYDTRNVVDKVRSNLGLTGSIFGLSALNPKVDAFGQPMTNDLIYGLTPSPEHAKQVDAYLTANDIAVTIPAQNTRYKVPGTQVYVTFTPNQYHQYVTESGQKIYDELSQRIPQYEKMDSGAAKKTIQNTVNQIRVQERAKIINQIKSQSNQP